MRTLIVRNSTTTDDLFAPVEEYIRNYRGPDQEDGYSEEVSFSSLMYRFPYRIQSPWKIIRDETLPPHILTIIPAERSNFQYREFPNQFYDFDLMELFQALDEPKDGTIAGSALLALFTHEGEGPAFRNLILLVKDSLGRLVNYRTGELLYKDDQGTNHDYRQHQYLTYFPIAAFKMGNLPIYSLILNNQFVQNKVLFVNKSEEMTILAENDGVGRIRDMIFYPQFSPNVATVGKDNILVNGDTFELNLFGSRTWKTFNGTHTAGSILALEDILLPEINDELEITTNLTYQFTGNGQLKFTLPYTISAGFLKIAVNTGAFFTECIDALDRFDFDFMVHRGKR